MPPHGNQQRFWPRYRPTFALLSLLAGSIAAALAQPPAAQVLRVGTTPDISLGAGRGKEQGALDSLKQFIRDETGLDNEIVKTKSWEDLAGQMANKQLPVGVFQGYEFAWASGKYSQIQPLALAVNGSPYVTAYVVARKDNQAATFAQLQGQSFAEPPESRGFPWFFVERQCQALGKSPATFFSKITTPANVEDALDDVVDGVVQGTAVDRAGLEAFRRRKPARFAQLKEVLHSPPAPPPVVAYAEGALDKNTLDRFRTGLLRANQQERGRTLLTVFHLTGFEPPPADFAKVLAQTRAAYPPAPPGK